MVANFQWATGFEILLSTSYFGGCQPGSSNIFLLGWDVETTNPAPGKYEVLTLTPDTTVGNRFLRGTAAQVINDGSLKVSPYTSEGVIYRSVVDANKMCLSWAQMCGVVDGGAAMNKLRIGISGGGNFIHAGVKSVGGVMVAALYINDVEVQVGTQNLSTGKPWFYCELFVDKVAGTVTLRINGVNECGGTMPAGFIAQQAEIRQKNSGSSYSQYADNIWIDDILFYDGSDPLGFMKVDGYFKTGDVLTNFNDSTDFGSAATTVVNSTAFSSGYRACSTAGSRDLFNYNNILPGGIVADTIYAVIHEIDVSSGSYVKAPINAVFKSGSTTQVVDITSLAQPFTPRYSKAFVFHTDPDTGSAWTRAAVQAIQTGYEVKP